MRKTTKPSRADLERELGATKDALEMALSLSPETDNNFFTGGLSGAYADRNSWDRKKVFAESLRAWRVNPIARRIVRLTRSFLIGKGVEIKSDDPGTQKFLLDWWGDGLNKFDRNIPRWLDEITRTGNLFSLFTVKQDGMTYIRAVPAEQIDEIKTQENDVEQEIEYTRDALDKEPYPAYKKGQEQTLFVVHHAVNQPVGSSWGEGDLPPLLVWIGRFSTFLEDRVRLNHFRTAYVYTVTGTYKNEQERSDRQKYLNANPPKPGSILVLNANNGEVWEAKTANLQAYDANEDGLAVKKNILSGLGYPMHWFAEPEGSNKTTAEAAGTPTFRTLEEMQDDFFEMLCEIARVAVEVRAQHGDRTVKPGAKIWIAGPDITERDNATLAMAVNRVYPFMSEMYDRGLVDEEELLRVTYRMMADTFDGTIVKGQRRPLMPVPVNVPEAEPPPEPEPEPEPEPAEEE